MAIITNTEIIDRTREIKLADVRALLGDETVHGTVYPTTFTPAEQAENDAAGRQLWIAGRFNTVKFHAQTRTGGTYCNKSATGDAMTVDALPDYARPCDECNAILRAVEATSDLVELDNLERTISIVASEGIAWEATGRAVDAGGWLGNATEHDREAIRTLARQVARTGRALRIEFGSVMTFVMDYAGGRYRLYVPSDDAPALSIQVLPLA